MYPKPYSIYLRVTIGTKNLSEYKNWGLKPSFFRYWDHEGDVQSWDCGIYAGKVLVFAVQT